MAGKNPVSLHFKRFWNWTLKNWPTKLLALAGALVLWATLITQDASLTREIVFSDVNIAVTGAETMKRNGFIVTSDLSQMPTVLFRADVPQLQYSEVQASNYNVRIDLSKIREAGPQTIKLSSTSTATYGAVTDISPAEVELQVEEYVTRYRIPVSVLTSGKMAEGYYASSPTMGPAVIAVSGPASVVNTIVRAEAMLDLSTLPAREGTIRTAVDFRLVAADGGEVDNRLLEVTSESVLLDSIIAEQTIYSLRNLYVSDLGMIAGQPANGYEVKQVTLSPSVVEAAGREENLELLDNLFVDAHVDVTGLKESVNEQFRIRKPSELAYLSTDSVTVAVEIGPIITERIFDNVKVSLRNIGTGLRVSADASAVQMNISGEQLWVDSLRNSAVSAYCDLTGLKAGTYVVPVQAVYPASSGSEEKVEISPASITVTLTEK